MKKILSLNLSIILVILISACSTSPTSPTATSDSRIQKYTGEHCPTSNAQAEEFYNNGISLSKQKKIEESQSAFSEAIKLDENFCDAMSAKGVLFRSVGDVKQAIDWYSKAIAVSPDFIAAHQNLAFAYRIQGKTKEAIEEYEVLIKLEPNNPEGYYGLGSVYADSKKYQDSVSQLEKAEALYKAQNSPAVVDAQVGLGLSHFYLENFAKSRDYFELAYPKRGNEATINYYLGLCYLYPEIENIQLAKKYLMKAKELGAEIPPNVLQMINK
jgi:tetratricopeptide (TPR) repeat protein